MKYLTLHKNTAWLLFLAIFALFALGYSSVALYKIYRYSRLTSQAPAKEVQWQIKKNWLGKYYIEATYNYEIQNKDYAGTTEFLDAYYVNTWAADQKISLFKDKTWQIAYQPTDPNHSTLQKRFPTQECYSAAVVLGLLLYFVILGIYVGIKHGTHHSYK